MSNLIVMTSLIKNNIGNRSEVGLSLEMSHTWYSQRLACISQHTEILAWLKRSPILGSGSNAPACFAVQSVRLF